MNTENHYQETDLGNISLNPRGEYNPEESYEYLDLVVLEGGSYVCLAENGATITGISPESGKTTQYWQVITIPGSLTPEYIAMHDRVVNLSEQVEADAEEVRTAEQNVSGMELNVTQMQEQTRQSAEAAEQSKDSSAGYAASADASRQAAEESKQNIDAQVTGFDSHVAEKTEEAENDIEAARIAANKAIIAQQEQSVNEVARAGIEAISTAQSAAQTATEKAQAADTSEKNAAASETAAKLSETNATKMAEQVAADKEQVANDRTAVENAKQEMTGSVAQIEQNTQRISELKGDLSELASASYDGKFDLKSVNWEVGSININTGENMGATQIRTHDYILVKKGKWAIINPTEYRVRSFHYSVDGTFLNETKDNPTGETTRNATQDMIIRLVLICGSTDTSLASGVSVKYNSKISDSIEELKSESANVKGRVSVVEDRLNITPIEWELGLYSTSTGLPLTETGIRTKDFIDTHSNKITIINKFETSAIRIYEYSDNNHDSFLRMRTVTVSTGQFTVNDIDCNYIKVASSNSGNLSDAEYIGIDIEKINFDKLIESYGLEIGNFMLTSAKTPVFCWMDDYGNTTEPLGLSKAVSMADEFGHKLSLACVTKYLKLADDSGKSLVSDLQSYQRNGHQVLSHSYSHNTEGRWNAENTNPNDAIYECVRAIEDLDHYGFIHHGDFCLVGGHADSVIINVVKNYARSAFKAASSNPSNDYNHLQGDGRYKIKRCFVRNDSSGIGLNGYKAVVDNAIANGDMVVFGSHSGDNSEWDDDLMRGVMSYVVEKGYKIVTVHEALEQRLPMYRFCEMFS